MISGDDGSQVIIEEDTIVLIDESISTGSDDGTQAADDIGLPEIDIGLPVLEDFTLGDITESLVEETLNDVLDDISAGVDLQATTGVDIQETTGIEVIDITGADVLEDITELESVTMPLARPEIIEELEEEILPDEPNLSLIHI